MNHSHDEHITHVVRSVEQRIRDRPDEGALDAETVLALDVLTHALTFAQAEDSLMLWREALWQRTLSERSQTAMVRMLEHLMAAAARGDMAAVTESCNCLEAVMSPEVFRRPVQSWTAHPSSLRGTQI